MTLQGIQSGVTVMISSFSQITLNWHHCLHFILGNVASKIFSDLLNETDDWWQMHNQCLVLYSFYYHTEQKLLAMSHGAPVPREANLNWFCLRWLLESETLAHRDNWKPCQIFWGLFNLPVEKGNSASSPPNTHVTVLVRALSQLAKFFFSWKLFMHIQRYKLECVPLTGKKLITCNSRPWHSNALVSSLRSGKREWFLMETSLSFGVCVLIT